MSDDKKEKSDSKRNKKDLTFRSWILTLLEKIKT